MYVLLRGEEIPYSGTIQLAAVWVVRNAMWKTHALIGLKRGRSPTVNGVSVSKVPSIYFVPTVNGSAFNSPRTVRRRSPAVCGDEACVIETANWGKKESPVDVEHCIYIEVDPDGRFTATQRGNAVTFKCTLFGVDNCRIENCVSTKTDPVQRQV
ncbi:hypothetical protein F2P81_014882 [Scophthalmus maximus]|uniref:Uncharacterized protein n=1 Tax=Scophthalmus maximus TaxID=52904 RepID=A0A6A4SQI3_SCOMX|nr:hypothetical protein F2P81_014882 [Scophthalmus maximus]